MHSRRNVDASGRWSRQRIASALIACMAGSVLIAVVLYFRWSPPQLSGDEAVFKTVDAMYTAIRSHDSARLAECEMRLDGYQQAGRLSEPARAHLRGVAADASRGGWDVAARTLYRFMLAQRAERAPSRADSNELR